MLLCSCRLLLPTFSLAIQPEKISHAVIFALFSHSQRFGTYVSQDPASRVFLSYLQDNPWPAVLNYRVETGGCTLSGDPHPRLCSEVHHCLDQQITVLQWAISATVAFLRL